jgi:hypothetical protein
MQGDIPNDTNSGPTIQIREVVLWDNAVGPLH